MTTEIKKDPRKNFTPRYWPWILAAVMLGVYWVTLERWVSMFNVDSVAKVSGWTWQPEIFNPLNYLLTYPLHWLPTPAIPVALNLFAAVCGALTLGLLARTVAIMPQDRTEPQRMRETSDFLFLTTKTAWLPPLLAVLVCGLQFTFWENATNFTGETVDLLAFAFTIWSLLEYRLGEQEGRLMLASFVYGADMSQNFGAIGFLPLLIGALVWIRGFSFFNAGFLKRMTLCGLAGLSLYFLMPTLAVAAGKLPGNLWWTALRLNLSGQWHMIRFFFTDTDFRHSLGLISLTTLLPLTLLAFRWKADFGDRSRLGSTITGSMINVVFGMLLVVCVWGAFDPPFTARHLGSGLPCLTFYYLAALSVGYLSGYFMLVAKVLPLRNSFRPPRAIRRMMAPAAIVGVVVLTILAASGLVSKNGPAIKSLNSGFLHTYARLMESNLPRTGGILLADNETSPSDSPRRLFLVQEALADDGRENEFVPVDTYSLNAPDYHRFLHKKYPGKWPLTVDAKTTSLLESHGLAGLLKLVSATNDIYYLHPSFGYYFEVFYPEPHGLVCKLKLLPPDNLLPRLPDSTLRAENKVFWTQAETEAFAPIIREVAPVDSFAPPQTLIANVMARLHVKPEVNVNARQAGEYYSRSLDFWGVEEQRANDLADAAACFKNAQALNPDNLVAGFNLNFNQQLQAGKPATVDLSKNGSDQFGKYRSWGEILTANGPFDDPGFCYEDGESYFQGGLFHQALASFTRVRELVPDHLPTLLSIGELYVFARLPDLALEALKQPLAHPDKFSLTDENSTELNILAASAYIQKKDLTRGVSLIEKEIAHHPDNEELLMTAAQAYMTQGLFTNALHVIKLKLLLTPGDPTWLYSEGYTYMRLNDYEEAIAPLTQVLNLQTNNTDAQLNRAIAYLNTGKLDAARDDYKKLRQTTPNSFQVAYGLGEIAWREHDTNAVISNYTVYLANAPTNTAEAKMISQRLTEAKGKLP